MARKKLILKIPEKEICKLYQDGTKVTTILEKAGLPYRNALYSILKRNGISAQGRKRGCKGTRLTDPEFRKKLVDMYATGVTAKVISETLGITQPDVFKYLNRFGVELNRQPNAQRLATKYIVAITPKDMATTYSNMLNSKVAASDFVRKTIVEEDLEGDLLINISKWHRTTGD